jgi:branched-chain amino acid transport system permease protein
VTRDRVGRLLLRWVLPFPVGYLALHVLLANRRPPFGIFLFGAVLGLLYAMVAFGLILIYRANRIINFGIAEMGAFCATAAVLLIKSRWEIPYVVAFAIALGTAMVAGIVVDSVVVRWFAKSPRLILSVATIFVGLIFAYFQFFLPQWITGRIVDPAPPETPFSGLTATVGGFRFDANALVVVLAVALVVVGLSLFFRITDTGLAVRAAAENADRAALLGIPVRRVSTIVWMIGTALAALGVFLRAPVVGLPVGVLVGPQVLLFALTAAVAGRMERFTDALVCAVGLGVLEQTLYYFSGNPSIASAVVLPVLLALMLLQRGQLSRGHDSGVATWSLAAEYRPTPPELRRLPIVEWVTASTKALTLLAVVCLPFALGVFHRNIASVVVVFAIVGVSLVILTGWAGQISLGQWGFAGIGAAVAGGMSSHANADFFVCLLAAGLVGAVAAVVVGLPALRIQGLYLAVATLAFSIAVQVYVLSPQYTSWLLPPREEGIRRPLLYGRFDLTDDTVFYWVALIFLGLALLSARALRNSRTGRILVATRDNQRGAQSYGISVERARLTAFAISGFWAAIGGGIFAFHQGAIDQLAFRPETGLLMLTIVVVGGLTSLPGAVLGAVFIGWTRYGLSSEAQFLVGAGGSLLILMFLRGGLAQVIYAARDGMLRWVADRQGLLVPSLVADRRAEAGEVEGEADVVLDAAEAVTL